jgi:hypothetical protein
MQIPNVMTQIKRNHSGTVVVTLILLTVIAVVILSVARYFWVDSANKYFDGLISVYIMENKNLSENDRDRLKKQLLEDGLFIKMNRWNKESFIKDRKLYDEMIVTRDRRQMREEENKQSVTETIINM